MEQGLSWEADSSSVNKDVPCMLWNLQVCYHVQRRTCHLYVFNQTNHVHIFLSCYFEDPFLGTFAKLRKATISFFFFFKASSCLSICMEELGSHTGRIFMKSDVWIFSTNMSKKIQVSLKSDKNNGYVHEEQYQFLIISCSVLPRMTNISEK